LVGGYNPPPCLLYKKNLKNYFTVFAWIPNLPFLLLRGWERCLKVTLQTSAPENFRLCRWGDERTVKRAQTGSEDPHRRERNCIINLFFASAIPSGNDEAKAHLFSSPSSSSPVSQMEILANWNIQISLDLD
jgi:hypothetical protein